MNELGPHLERMVRAVFAAAIIEGREVELWNCITDGGSATIDFQTHKLVLFSGDVIRQMAEVESEHDESR